MLQTLGLILCGLIGTYVSVFQLRKTNYCWDSFKTIIQVLCVIGLFFPLTEEAIFRHTLKYYLSDLTYAYEINAILFGLIHIINYQISQSIIITGIQVITTAYLGYYVVQFDNLLYAILTHSLYNVLITSVSFAWYFYFKEKPSKDSLDINFPLFEWDSVWHNKTTQDDINIGKKFTDSYNFKIMKSRSKINKEMLNRIDKLNTIQNKRPRKFENICQ